MRILRTIILFTLLVSVAVLCGCNRSKGDPRTSLTVHNQPTVAVPAVAEIADPVESADPADAQAADGEDAPTPKPKSGAASGVPIRLLWKTDFPTLGDLQYSERSGLLYCHLEIFDESEVSLDHDNDVANAICTINHSGTETSRYQPEDRFVSTFMLCPDDGVLAMEAPKLQAGTSPGPNVVYRDIVKLDSAWNREWSWQAPEKVGFCLMTPDQRVYLLATDNETSSRVYCLDAVGTHLWTLEVDDVLSRKTAPAVDGGIRWTSRTGNLYNISPDGTVGWTFVDWRCDPLGRLKIELYDATGDLMIDEAGTTTYYNGFGELIAVDAAGAVKSRTRVDMGFMGSLARDGNGVNLVSAREGIICFDPDGGIRWEVKQEAFDTAILTVTDTGQVLGRNLSGVFELDPLTGEQLWLYRMDSLGFDLVITSDGYVFSEGMKGDRWDTSTLWMFKL